MEDRNNISSNGTSSSYEQESSETSFDFKTIFSMILLNWQWFALSVFVWLCVALVYLRYTNPVFKVSEKVLIKDEANPRRKASNQMLANMSDLGFMTNSTGIENEVEIISSRILARETVKDLRLYVEYKREGYIKNQLIYKQQPISVDIDSVSLEKMDETMLPIDMKISKNNGEYIVKGITYDEESGDEVPFETSFTSLPATYKTPAGVLTFTANDVKGKQNDRALFVRIYPPLYVATSYVNSMTVEPTSKITSIALITLCDQNRNRAEDFLKQLVVCYNRQANADKNEIAIKTEEFINGRLEKINAELGSTESALEEYKKRNNLTQIRLDAQETLTQASQYSSKLFEAKTQIQLLDYLREHMNNPVNRYQIIPSNIGLSDISSTALINSYNQNVLDRNRKLRTASEISPQVQSITSTLDELESSIRTALSQARKTAEIQLQSIERQYALYNNKVANTPEQERILTQIGRQQEVKSGLYLMLLQKREENSISLAATADKGKVIDDPIYEGKVRPKKTIILFGAFVLGFAMPLFVLYLIQLLRYKIEGHEDVARLTKLPIIADVALTERNNENGIVVHENQNNQIDEIYRAMRTNIQFMLKGDQRVIMFTSSTSGEGKTFNAANLSVSFASLGKKIILIGLDIRKPRLAKMFGFTDTNTGITHLLTKETITLADIEKQVIPSGISNNLDIMPAGPIPPNPTELLAREGLKEIIALLKEKYEYIILDTAPVGLVSDSIQIGKVADITVIVCRADYTPKGSFELINNLNAEHKLPNMCYVINGIDMSKKKYGYYYGYGKYGRYGRYTSYGGYSYGNYSNSHYSNKDDKSIKL